MAEDSPCTLLLSEGNQRGHYGQRHGGNGKELEKAGIDSGDEIADAIDDIHTQKAQNRTDSKGSQPPKYIFSLHIFLINYPLRVFWI